MKPDIDLLSSRISSLSQNHTNNSYYNYDASFNKKYLTKIKRKYTFQSKSLQKKAKSQNPSTSDLLQDILSDIKAESFKRQGYEDRKNQMPPIPLAYINPTEQLTKKEQQQVQQLLSKTQPINKAIRAKQNQIAHHAPIFTSIMKREDLYFFFLQNISPNLRKAQHYMLGSTIFIQKMLLIFYFTNFKEDEIQLFLKYQNILKTIQPYVNFLKVTNKISAVIVDTDRGFQLLQQQENEQYRIQIHQNDDVKLNFEKKFKFMISLIDEQFKFIINGVEYYILNRKLIEKVQDKIFKVSYHQNIIYFQGKLQNLQKDTKKLIKSIVALLNCEQNKIEGEILGKIFLGIQLNNFFPQKKLITGVYMTDERMQMFQQHLLSCFTTVIPIRIDELIILRQCPVVVPDSFGKGCYFVQNLYVLEIIVLKPVNNFLFGTQNYAFYKWNSEKQERNRLNKQDLHECHQKELMDELVLENALINLKIKENEMRIKNKKKRLEEKKSLLLM